MDSLQQITQRIESELLADCHQHLRERMLRIANPQRRLHPVPHVLRNRIGRLLFVVSERVPGIIVAIVPTHRVDGLLIVVIPADVAGPSNPIVIVSRRLADRFAATRDVLLRLIGCRRNRVGPDVMYRRLVDLLGRLDRPHMAVESDLVLDAVGRRQPPAAAVAVLVEHQVPRLVLRRLWRANRNGDSLGFLLNLRPILVALLRLGQRVELDQRRLAANLTPPGISIISGSFGATSGFATSGFL